MNFLLPNSSALYSETTCTVPLLYKLFRFVIEHCVICYCTVCTVNCFIRSFTKLPVYSTYGTVQFLQCSMVQYSTVQNVCSKLFSTV